MKQGEIDEGRVEGVTSNDRQRMKKMVSELKELKCANLILRMLKGVG